MMYCKWPNIGLLPFRTNCQIRGNLYNRPISVCALGTIAQSQCVFQLPARILRFQWWLPQCTCQNSQVASSVYTALDVLVYTLLDVQCLLSSIRKKLQSYIGPLTVCDTQVYYATKTSSTRSHNVLFCIRRDIQINVYIMKEKFNDSSASEM